MQSFEGLFKQATSHQPFLYQARLATGDIIPPVLNAPTGSGKTAAAFFTWLWRRRYHQNERVRLETPRRLVYCLPMRVLVEQTCETVKTYLEALDPEPGINVHLLMGGEADEEWQLEPEQEAVIIGTQDMLLSRALNRGYAMSRFRWPVPFAFLNNDAFWIIDELQLMGSGVPSTAQLKAFREQMATFGPAKTMWMSATVNTGLLHTADHNAPGNEEIFRLNKKEAGEQRIKRCLEARKMLAPFSLNSGPNAKGYPAELAAKILEHHRRGKQTLVILNTVNRAQALAAALNTALSKNKAGAANPELLLLHSRFRPQERRGKNALLAQSPKQESPGRIIVSTQVIEAGVDITSACLFTELAPWSSMVQRFGRCNRYGEETEAKIYWIDVGDKASAPYTPREMEKARLKLEELEGCSASPSSLPGSESEPGDFQVLRKKDLLELFDTAPDLSGNDVDVSSYIRDADETDVYLCWRDWDGEKTPPRDEPRQRREELCPVPIGQLREFISGGRSAYIWDYHDRTWRRIMPGDLFPGQILLLHTKTGGYDTVAGWDPSSTAAVPPLQAQPSLPNEAGGDDLNTFTGGWQSLKEHSLDVLGEMETLLSSLEHELNSTNLKEDLCKAALWHDLGKAHPVFQETLLDGLNEEEKKERSGCAWAKAPHEPGRPFLHSRPHFRHELASALALLESGAPNFSDLALFLVASHHGKVRLAIRSLPGSDGHQHRSESPSVILGIEEGDIIPRVDLGNGRFVPETTLKLQVAEIGATGENNSWTTRTLTLLDNYGPFRLAYLEALLRTADIRASIKAKQEVKK